MSENGHLCSSLGDSLFQVSRIITGLKNGRIKQFLFCFWKHAVQLLLFYFTHTGCSITGASHKAFLCVCIVAFTGHYLWARCSLRPSDTKTIENHLRQPRSRAHWSCVNISSISFYTSGLSYQYTICN